MEEGDGDEVVLRKMFKQHSLLLHSELQEEWKEALVCREGCAVCVGSGEVAFR